MRWPTRVLNELGNATDQTHDAEPQENADQHSHMQINVNGNLRGRGVWHRYPTGVPALSG